MSVEYNLEKVLCFPKKIHIELIGEYYVVIAPEYPNWLVLNENEYRMFYWLNQGLSIRKTLEKYYEKICSNEEICLDIMTRLLSQIDNVDFRADAEILKEEPIENITKKIHIGTTNGCNMHCKHCFMAAGTMPLQTIDLDKTINLVSEVNKIYGKLEIVVSGGEPLAYRDLEKLLKAIKDNYVILFTNGSLITEKNIDAIAECCDEVQVSFEGVSREAYSIVRGIENYDRVLHAIDLLKQRKIKIVLAITVLPDTLEDVKNNLITFIERLNYDKLEVRLNDEIEMTGNAVFMDMSLYKKEESKKTIIKLFHDLENKGIHIQDKSVRNIQFTNCGIGTNLVINYDGKVYPCHKLSKYSLDVGTNVSQIIKDFNEINRETSNDFIRKCQNCELRYICSGGCRIDNLEKNNDMNKVICNETYKMEQYKKIINDYKMYMEEI